MLSKDALPSDFTHMLSKHCLHNRKSHPQIQKEKENKLKMQLRKFFHNDPKVNNLWFTKLIESYQTQTILKEEEEEEKKKWIRYQNRCKIYAKIPNESRPHIFQQKNQTGHPFQHDIKIYRTLSLY